MANPLDCPGSEGWQALRDGTLPPNQLALWEDHLEACPACRARLDEGAEGEDELRRRARRVGDPTVLPCDPTLAQFLERMREDAALAPATPAGPADLSFLRPCDRPGVLGTLGAYEVREFIGQGGMGVVLKAYEPALRRLVAIKVLAPALAASATARRRFRREARAAAAIRHDHVVTVHGVHETEGLPYLVMQYVAGESLQERLDRAGPPGVGEAVRIGREAAAGLAAAHARGLVHRDLKPANLLLEEGSEHVRITDFGLARATEDARLTQSGVVAGTPEYMAPEQARGEAADQRSDLFSLGSVLYALCTGEPPFRAETPLAVLRRVEEETPRPVRELNPDVPAWLAAVIDRLHAGDPARRFQSAAEVAGLLEAHLAHLREPAAVPAPAPASPSRPGRRWWPLPALALTLLLTALALARWLPPAHAPAPAQAPAAGQAVPFEWEYDFRGSRPLPPDLHPAGALHLGSIRPEDAGLRVTLAGDRPNPIGRAGLEMTTPLHGDFEITAGYELLRYARPTEGFGVGFELFAQTVHKPQLGMGVYRVARVEQGEVYLVSRSYLEPDGTPNWAQENVPTNARAGRLRLSRTGTEVTALAAEGNDGPFQELQRYDLGPDDITALWLMAYTGHCGYPDDLRITFLKIRAGVPIPSPPRAEATAPGGDPSSWARSRLWRPLAVLLGLTAVAACVWWFARRGRARPCPPAAGKATVSWVCAACGKNLRAGTALAGKKVRCPHCGQAVLVPATAAGGDAPPGVPPRSTG
jgi:DNA-directed RNA polymerase subunit RPC12/RpoP